jgi:PTS system nitrogen regulatory IIA component
MSLIRMADLITPDRIVPIMHARDKQQAVVKLSRLAATKIWLSEDAVREAVLTRDDLTTFAVGRGIAIPHAIVAGIGEPVGAFARLRRPVDFGASDGRHADLVFLLLAPETHAGVLLRALSCVARRLRDREVAKRLRAETKPDAAHVILTADSWRQDNPDSDRRRAA